MNFVTKFLSVLGLTVALSTNAVAAVLLVTDTNGILTGANGVDVGGTLYNVTFADGILDASAITAFTTSEGALAASQALLDQVLLGQYDTLELVTKGCAIRLPCGVLSPVIISSSNLTLVGLAINWDNEVFDEAGTQLFAIGRDVSSEASYTLARWTPVAAVPEPETYAMMFAGLGLLGFLARRRKQKATV